MRNHRGREPLHADEHAAAGEVEVLTAQPTEGLPVRVRIHASDPGGAADIVENYRRAMAGEPLINQVDRAKGY